MKRKLSIGFRVPFSNETASRVLEGTKKVVNDSNGTGYAAIEMTIFQQEETNLQQQKPKASKDDTSGTELGWFTNLQQKTSGMSYIDYQYGRRCRKERGEADIIVKKRPAWFWKSGLAVISLY